MTEKQIILVAIDFETPLCILQKSRGIGFKYHFLSFKRMENFQLFWFPEDLSVRVYAPDH